VSFAPASLIALADYWKANGGVLLGIVGNDAHLAGYHLGKDRIYDGSGPGQGDNDYSVQLPRDKAGLTNAASAIDLGKLNGQYKNLRSFSRWLVAQLMADAVVRRDFREVIYSPDGLKVQRYSAIDNDIHAGGDTSHLTHTHLSYLRDSQGRDKTFVFRPYFAEDVTVPVFKAFATPKYVTVPDGAWLYKKADLSTDAGNIQISPGPRDMPVSGKLSDGTLIIGYVDTTPTELELATYYVKGLAPRDYSAPVPPPADCTAEVAAATQAERERIAVAEGDRIRAI